MLRNKVEYGGCIMAREIKKLNSYLINYLAFYVRLIGLEPTRLATPDPKSGAATNYATGAKQ